jgi:FkbM family methyltransferase
MILIIRILNKLKLLPYFNLIGKMTLNNTSFKIPIIKMLGLTNIFMSEIWMIDLLKKLDLSDGKFIDIGVNIGQTLLKLRSVNRQIEYIGFEPNATCVYYSNELIKANGFKNTSIIPTGISNVNGILKLDFYSHNATDPSASIVDNFRPHKEVKFSQYIPINTIDNISQSVDLTDIKMIKIDVEGAELEVLESMKDLIQKNQPLILIEVLPAYSKDNTVRIERQEKIEALLTLLDYCIYKIVKTNEKVESIKQLSTFGIHQDIEDCDYIFVPKELNIKGLTQK